MGAVLYPTYVVERSMNGIIVVVDENGMKILEWMKNSSNRERMDDTRYKDRRKYGRNDYKKQKKLNMRKNE